jgi:hypothetical protein
MSLTCKIIGIFICISMLILNSKPDAVYLVGLLIFVTWVVEEYE